MRERKLAKNRVSTGHSIPTSYLRYFVYRKVELLICKWILNKNIFMELLAFHVFSTVVKNGFADPHSQGQTCLFQAHLPESMRMFVHIASTTASMELKTSTLQLQHATETIRRHNCKANRWDKQTVPESSWTRQNVIKDRVPSLLLWGDFA